MRVSSLHIYPIKSLGGISLPSSVVDLRGLKYDRRWMLIDNKNTFLTQRTKPTLAKFSVLLMPEHLLVTNQVNLESIRIPISPETARFETVKVWDDEIRGQLLNYEINEWFSDQLLEDVRLVFQPEDAIRRVDSKYSINGLEHTSLSDGYPILVISLASLNYLNERCSETIEMKKFRPNIVIDDCAAFQEDTIREVKINDTQLFGVKPCARCIMTTIDYQKLEFGKEPLLTLSKFRKFENKILFGQNMVVHKEGQINVGDNLTIF